LEAVCLREPRSLSPTVGPGVQDRDGVVSHTGTDRAPIRASDALCDMRVTLPPSGTDGAPFKILQSPP